MIGKMGLGERGVEPAIGGGDRDAKEFLRRNANQTGELIDHVRLVGKSARICGRGPGEAAFPARCKQSSDPDDPTELLGADTEHVLKDTTEVTPADA